MNGKRRGMEDPEFWYEIISTGLADYSSPEFCFPRRGFRSGLAGSP